MKTNILKKYGHSVARLWNKGSIFNNLLKENEKFVNSKHATQVRDLKHMQKPIAVVVTCSDSRVVPEYIFMQEIGKLFVVRNAGNIVYENEIGSIEFAVSVLKVKNIIILGHTSCGAISATVHESLQKKDNVNDTESNESVNLGAILEEIRPSIGAVMLENGNANIQKEELIEKVANMNVFRTSAKLLEKSKLLKDLYDLGKIQFAHWKYSLDDGTVIDLEAGNKKKKNVRNWSSWLPIINARKAN